MSTVIISGLISRCKITVFGSGFGSGYDVTVSGKIEYCDGLAGSFGYASIMVVSGTIENCNGTTQCFGSTTSAGKIINCRRTSKYGFEVHEGLIERCTFENGLILAAGAKVRHSTIYGGAITGTGNVSIYHCSLDTAITGVTNLVTTPYNVIDANI